jgi:hypothetical protein
MQFPIRARQSAFDRAIQRLRDGRTGESGYGRRVALVLTIPMYEDPTALDIRRSATTGELYVVRTVWRRALDTTSVRETRETFMNARMLAVGLDIAMTHQPSLVSSSVPVDPTRLEALLESVAAATITCHVSQPRPPIAATIFELTFGDELTETRFRWAAEPPEGWSALGVFVRQLMHLVDAPAHAASR